MRRLVFAILALSLLFSLTLHEGNISTVEASPSIHQGDLILNGNNMTMIEGRFDINGSIIVEENATLVLRDATLNFTMSHNYQFNVTLRNPVNGNPRLIVENATVATNNYYLDMSFYENASMRANKLSTDYYLYIWLYMDSLALVSNSTFGYISAYDFSILSVSNSTFDGIYDDDYTHVTISNSDFYLLEPNDKSEVTVANSTIGLLVAESMSVNYSVTHHEPSFTSNWNFLENCSVVAATTGMAPNITLTNTQVENWGFAAYGESNITVFNSKLWGLWGRGSSDTSVYNTSISYFLVSDNSAYWHLYNTTTERLYSRGNSVLWFMNSTSNLYEIYDESEIYVCWYLDVHVVDSIGQEVPFANVTATYPNSTLADSKITDVDGWARLTLVEKTINATGSYPIGNYTITAKYNTYQEQQSVEMTENKMIVIPEFPSFIILPLFMITTLIAVIVYRRKRDIERLH